MRRANSADMEFIKEISRNEMQAIVVEAWQGKFNWSSWFADTVEAITNSYHRIFIIEVTNEEVGYLWLNEEPQTVWITAIVLKRAWQRQQIGGLIMNYLIQEAVTSGKGAIELGVQHNNMPAREFYSKLGFKQFDHLKTANTVLVRLDLTQITTQASKEDAADL